MLSIAWALHAAAWGDRQRRAAAPRTRSVFFLRPRASCAPRRARRGALRRPPRCSLGLLAAPRLARQPLLLITHRAHTQCTQPPLHSSHTHNNLPTHKRRPGRSCGFARLRGEGLDYVVRSYSVTLGRRAKERAADVPVSAHGAVSRRHAEIKYSFERGQWELEVTGKGGAAVNGAPVAAGAPAAPLKSQDRVTIGDATFWFLLPRAGGAVAAGGAPAAGDGAAVAAAAQQAAVPAAVAPAAAASYQQQQAMPAVGPGWAAAVQHQQQQHQQPQYPQQHPHYQQQQQYQYPQQQQQYQHPQQQQQYFAGGPAAGAPPVGAGWAAAVHHHQQQQQPPPQYAAMAQPQMPGMMQQHPGGGWAQPAPGVGVGVGGWGAAVPPAQMQQQHHPHAHYQQMQQQPQPQQWHAQGFPQ